MARPIRVLFGSETGNAEDCARRLAKRLKSDGRAAEATPMHEYDPALLAGEPLVFVVTSTYGNGDPPSNAETFMHFVKRVDAPRMDSVRFAVCALGDTTYDRFCGCGKDFDTHFERLGGQRVFARVDCDVDFEKPFERFADAAVAYVCEHAAEFAAPNHASLIPPPLAPAPAAATDSAHSRDRPFLAQLLDARWLGGTREDGETRHYELSTAGSGMPWSPGDSVGIVASNDPAEVDEVLGNLALAGDAEVTDAQGRSTSLRTHLVAHACLQRIGRELLALLARGEGPARAVRDADPASQDAWVNRRHVVDALREHRGVQVTAQELTDALRPLRPRLYSVASSPKFSPDRLALTVKTLRYTHLGRERVGVASSFLAQRVRVGEHVPIFLQPNHAFRLPRDSAAPIVMIGPGTGVAPFRAFLQDRAATGATGRTWLFFGHRTAEHDFLYREELEGMVAAGTLARLDLAWSREQAEKRYVQHCMLEHASELFEWLRDGAHVYVCGDAAHMARDVHAALIEVHVREGALSADDARAAVERLAAAGRYLRDVY